MLRLEDFYSVSQVAKALEISEASIRKLATDGVFKPSSQDSKTSYSVEDVQALAVFFLLRKEDKSLSARKAAQIAKRVVSAVGSPIIPLAQDAPTGTYINVCHIKKKVIDILLNKFCHE